MNIREDPKLQRMFIRKNLSKSRKQIYTTNFTRLYELTGKTPSELIAEAKEEQRPYIKDNQIVEIDIDDRNVTKYLYAFYNSMNVRKLKEATMKTNMAAVRSFYKEYKVDLPDPIQITLPRRIIREGDIPNIEDIRKGIDQTPYIKYKAAITLIASSGIRSGDVRYFTIGNFLDATKDYHDGTLESLFNYKGEIIPVWDFIPRKTRKQGNICITFNSPEASEYIIDYLKVRIRLGENLTQDSFLFRSKQNEQYSNKGFLWIFHSVNQEAFNYKDKNGRSFFRAHNLRKFFLSTFRQNSTDYFTLKVVAGHSISRNNDENYQEIPIHQIRSEYLKVLPYLTIHETKIHDVKTEEFLKLEKELAAKEDRMKELEEKMNEKDLEVEKLKKQFDHFQELVVDKKYAKDLLKD